MLFRRRSLALVALALTGCGGAARVGGDSGHARVLTLMNPVSDRQEITVYAEEVARLSEGRLRIRVVPSPHLARTDYEARVIDDVRHGRADLGWAGSRAWTGSLRALNAPLLIDSYALQERVLRDGVANRMLEELRPLGLAGLGVLPGPMRRPVGAKGRLVVPREYRGRAIGQQQSAVAEATLRALGARPVALSVSRDEPGLGGLETSLPAVEGGRYDAPGSHLSENVNLWPRPLVVFANSRALAQLSDRERGILRRAAAAAEPRLLALQRGNDAEIAGNVCRRGRMTFDSASPADLRALRAAVEPVYRDLGRDPATRAALATITALKRQLTEPPAALPPCRRQAGPEVRTRSRLDGTWRMDSARSAAGPEFLDENWGRWVFVFDRGRFAITQENRTSCTWGYGAYTVDGDTTTWRFADGGGQAPNGAENKPGEQFSYRLSAYRDAVTLAPVKGAVSPPNFNPKPWRRIGAPARGKLSRRCPPPDAALAP